MSDLKDKRLGTYDPVNDPPHPQPEKIRQEREPADELERPSDLPPGARKDNDEESLPEGIRRRPVGPYGSVTGRREQSS